MLLKFRLGNFKSIGDSQEFSTIPGQYRNKSDHVFETEKYKSLKVSAIFGANASGKSNFINSIMFLKLMIIKGEVLRSHNDLRFRLKDLGENTNFEVEIGLDEKIFIYGVSSNINEGVVNREYLYLSGSTSDTLVYDISDGEISHNVKDQKARERINIYFEDLKKGDFLLIKLAEAKEANDNIFILSKMLYKWFLEDLVIILPNFTHINKLTQFITKDENNEFSVIDILKTFDTGITDYAYQEMSLDRFLEVINPFKMDESEFYSDFIKDITKIKGNDVIETNIGGDFYRISFNKEKNSPIVQVLGFRHCDNNEKYFSYDEESDGTKRLIEVVNILYNIQSAGKTYIIDEIERSFHSNLTIEFIRKFLEYSKDNKAQLILTTHETNIMNFDLLRQDEIWLIDRDKSGMSNLFPLSDFKIRLDKVIDKDYLDGRYGGVPKILKIIEARVNDET